MVPPESWKRARWIMYSAAGALALCLIASMLSVPGVNGADRVYRIAHLSTAGRTPDGAPPRPLRDGLRDLGYIEGQNVIYTARFAEANVERLPALAAEIVAFKPDVIVAQGRPAVVAAKTATPVIPIVIAPASSDALATGLIESLPRPGGNVTGLTDELGELSAKRMQLLKETLPRATKVAVLWNANDPGMLLRYRAIESAAKFLNLDVESLPLFRPEDFDGAFVAMARRRPDALFLVTDALTNTNQQRVVEFSATQRVPAMYESSAVVRQGGLMSYGPTPEDMFQRAAAYIDRILRGAKAGDLPAEYPTRYYFVLNIKTAKALGLTIPPGILLRADQAIE